MEIPYSKFTEKMPKRSEVIEINQRKRMGNEQKTNKAYLLGPDS